MENCRETIDGKCYAGMLVGGAELISKHSAELNSLNVFPVADGDTGTNMTRTMEGGLARISFEDTDSIGEITEVFAKGVLLAARGNSGVILSQIFAGIGEGLSGLDTVDAIALARAYRCGIDRSYAAVKDPTEGTILTVFRESTEYAARNIDERSTVEDFFTLHVDEARRALARTKEQLPVLAEADVVDSGGAGYLCIAEGMRDVLTGKTEAGYVPDSLYTESSIGGPDISRFTCDSVLEFGYCTEFLLRLTRAKCDPYSFEITTLLSVLDELGGESVVAYKTEDMVKVHVHTFTPGEVLAAAQQFGEFLTVKIENMSLGHSDGGTAVKTKKEPKKHFSVVSVASGDGMKELFLQMGADVVIDGGQSHNPSVEQFVEAFEKCDAENIIVFPNNKNILLAAKGAADIYSGAAVHILESNSFMEGYAALAVITPGITDIDALVSGAKRALGSVVSAEVTCAVRDAVIDGAEIKEGQYMALSGGGLAALSQSAEGAVLEFLEDTDMEMAEIITLFAGRLVNECSIASLTAALEEKYPECEIAVYESGQDVYDYMVAVE